MAIPRYSYKPLNQPDEIRVLELGATKARIEARILHVPVSGRNFQALSYVWGKSDQTHEAIVLDELGKAIGWIPLTENLGNAICDLRDTEALESKVFWIDQICINQGDNPEKNHQVAMMNRIYTHARRVITYCGPASLGDEKETQGFRLLKRICRDVPDSTWRQMQKAGGLETIQDGLSGGSIHLDPLPLDLDLEDDGSIDENEISKRYVEQGWEWLVYVAYGPWTRRLWIVQEQLLNKDITALRGCQLIDWDDIVAIPILFAIGHLPQQYRHLGQKSLDENSLSLDQVELTLYGIWWDRHARQESGTSYTWSALCHNLQWYQPLLCQDSRDRVYAILAISRDTEQLGLTPDYSPLNTVDVLSHRLAVRVLESAVNLEFLSFSFSWRQPKSSLPSWCLALDCPADINTPENTPVEVYKPHPKSHGFRLARFSESNSILVVKGRILDYYVSTNPSSPLSWHHDDAAAHGSQIEFLCSLVYLLLPDGCSLEHTAILLRTIAARAPWPPPFPDGEVSGNGKSMTFHLWAYLRHNLHVLAECAEGSSAPASSSSLSTTTATTAQEVLERCNHIITKLTALLSATQIGFADSKLHLTDTISSEEEHKAVEKVLPYVLEQGRRLGRTRAGRFCNALYKVQEGDAIVALQGADQLFIIRPVEDTNTYRLIGDIYVDGLMHGEAYRGLDPDVVDYDIELV